MEDTKDMFRFRKFSLLALVGLLLTVGASAETAVEKYLAATDPLLIKIVQLNTEFKKELQPLREARDLMGISAAVDKYSTTWQKLDTELGKVKVPADAKAYHETISRLLEIQMASNNLLRETVDKGIKVAKEVQQMKNDGASEEDIQAKVNAFSSGRGALNKKIEALKVEAMSLDGTLKAERAKLDPK